jgi:hypothetical protein
MTRFPTVEWFEEVGRALAADPERLKRLGYVEATVGILVDDAQPDAGFVLEFAGYAPHKIRAAAHPVAAADFTIAGSLDDWRRMIDNIAANGEADLDHTLNKLTMAGTPFRLLGEDQLRLDLFFRFNQSFQAFFDAAAAVPTEFAVAVPA